MTKRLFPLFCLDLQKNSKSLKTKSKSFLTCLFLAFFLLQTMIKLTHLDRGHQIDNSRFSKNFSFNAEELPCPACLHFVLPFVFSVTSWNSFETQKTFLKPIFHNLDYSKKIKQKRLSRAPPCSSLYQTPKFNLS